MLSEVVLEITDYNDASLVLSLGVVPPTFWQGARDHIAGAIVSQNCVTFSVTIEYNDLRFKEF